ncbi:MAG: hypothetical protein AAGB29_13290 [Planctomycetota bacterium]
MRRGILVIAVVVVAALTLLVIGALQRSSATQAFTYPISLQSLQGLQIEHVEYECFFTHEDASLAMQLAADGSYALAARERSMPSGILVRGYSDTAFYGLWTTVRREAWLVVVVTPSNGPPMQRLVAIPPETSPIDVVMQDGEELSPSPR